MKIRSMMMGILLVLNFLTPQVSSAQEQSTTFKRSIATVLFSTLGGALLGLSTLSFYDNAQDHTENITVGSLLGFMGGVGYVAYNSSGSYRATESYTEIKQKQTPKVPVLVSYTFEF